MLKFTPFAFVDNLVYMGVGMLGIFLVIGILIGATYACNNLTGKKKNNNDSNQ